jgi:hypothetical protein
VSIRDGYKLRYSMKLQYIFLYYTSGVLSQRKRAKGRASFGQDITDEDYSAIFAPPSGSMLEQMIAMSMGSTSTRPVRKNRREKKKKTSEAPAFPGKCSKFK